MFWAAVVAVILTNPHVKGRDSKTASLTRMVRVRTPKFQDNPVTAAW